RGAPAGRDVPLSASLERVAPPDRRALPARPFDGDPRDHHHRAALEGRPGSRGGRVRHRARAPRRRSCLEKESIGRGQRGPDPLGERRKLPSCPRRPHVLRRQRNHSERVSHSLFVRGDKRERRASTRWYMEVSVKREDLLHGLYLVQGVVERRTPQPVLAHVLIESDEGGLALTATDMEVGLRARIAAKVKKGGSVTANARKL